MLLSKTFFSILYPLSERRKVTSFSLLYRYFHGMCSAELPSLVSPVLTFTAKTRHVTHIMAKHPDSFCILQLCSFFVFFSFSPPSKADVPLAHKGLQGGGNKSKEKDRELDQGVGAVKRFVFTQAWRDRSRDDGVFSHWSILPQAAHTKSVARGEARSFQQTSPSDTCVAFSVQTQSVTAAMKPLFHHLSKSVSHYLHVRERHAYICVLCNVK